MSEMCPLQQLLLMKQQQSGINVGGRPVDLRLLVDGSGNMPFHYASEQCLSSLLHPRSNLSAFALMRTAGDRVTRDSGASASRRVSSAPSLAAAADMALKEELRAQLKQARGEPPDHHGGGRDGRRVSLSDTDVLAGPPSRRGVVDDKISCPLMKLDLDLDSAQTNVQSDSPKRTQRLRFNSHSGSFQQHASWAGPHGQPSETSHAWRCELLPCQHSLCGGCAEELYESQEPAVPICCPICHTLVKGVKPAI